MSKEDKINELISILCDETNFSGLSPDQVLEKLVLEFNTRQTNPNGKLEFKNVLVGTQFECDEKIFLKLNKNVAYIDPMQRLNALINFHPRRMVIVRRNK